MGKISWGDSEGESDCCSYFSEVDDMLVQASVDIRVLKEAGLFSTVSVVCNGVVNGGVQGAGVFSNGCCGTIFEYQHCSCPCCL